MKNFSDFAHSGKHNLTISNISDDFVKKIDDCINSLQLYLGHITNTFEILFILGLWRSLSASLKPAVN